MIDNIKEAFDKTRVAGSIAARTLDEVTKIIKPGVTTNEIDKVCHCHSSKHRKSIVL